ncbi:MULTISPECIES: TerB family tellurite resistance protein [Acidiphilium]|uniref:Heat shock protein DnaJ domain protein n=1 Tax=Acidiphilium cryptum (strain JF-5) TaxID=349163 RepID=A5G2J2_ACICJ|nr:MULTISPECIES: TerB family tellurite resistance protein [Acidiphilium]ABQ32074.1 heat shock protein DnaJ domain protein [Acidiphilium cryptum JF-5]KDM67745.1 heat shock protein DnaJ domain protein [Acidiphilium sp. JA12-A1]MBS3022755.1 TerB family tellurite resistance protein [Acidiphilium multivorum]MDE2327287.1 TerB family tellurite resistance protein [Rhodospirillales bacterium]
MSVWGKIIGGVAGFAVGGPFGAVAGAALGHAADTGDLGSLGARLGRALPLDSARFAALLGRREQVFAIGATVLAAKLAKCDGPVVRAEIDAFKRQFRIEDAAIPTIGHLFDQAREDASGFEPYARQLGESFADNRLALEQVLGALFAIARADGPVNAREADMLARIGALFGLGEAARARAANPSGGNLGEDPYQVLGIARTSSTEAIRAHWKALMRENHPDQLAARGVPAEFIARATERVARINAAWDAIKRERGA